MTDAQIIAALQADAWVALPLAAGFTGHSGPFTPASRQRGDTVELCGRVDGTYTTGAGVTMATLVAPFIPASNVNLPCIALTAGNPTTAIVEIASGTGVITVVVGAAATAVVLDGLTYRLV